MTAIQAPTDSLVRAHGRGLLLSILEKEVLLKQLKVAHGGHFVAETMDWSSYWEPLQELGCSKVEDALEALHSAWQDHIRSGFGSPMRREFCFRYFFLLDVLLSNYSGGAASNEWEQALQTVLGFECFGLTHAASNSEVLGAGTCTLRNPCYLLAKLKMSGTLDDPQFLPLITAARSETPELFYHYRQYTLSPDSPMSLLFYLAVSGTKRSSSFDLINSLISRVSNATDPRTRERAQRLFKGIVSPIIQGRKFTESKSFTLEFVDVGAGTGGLTSSLCRQIQVLGASMGFVPRLRVWFVDLEPADPTRFFRAKRVQGSVDSLMFLGDDYRDWLSKPHPLPRTIDLRIALVSKLFNNLSRFCIRRLSSEELPLIMGKGAMASDLDMYSPAHSLALSGRGVEALAISNSRVTLHDGRTFAQPSLSDFYRGLYLALSPNDSVDPLEEGVFLPVRTFNPDCLVTLDSKSVIARLVENCDYVVIEDADLTRKDIVHHMTRFALHSVTVRDVTRTLRLTGNYAYVVWPRMGAGSPDFSGEQIW